MAREVAGKGLSPERELALLVVENGRRAGLGELAELEATLERGVHGFVWKVPGGFSMLAKVGGRWVVYTWVARGGDSAVERSAVVEGD